MHIGIDGCRGGWLVAMIAENQRLQLSVISHLEELKYEQASPVYIDIPLHFAEKQYRTCEIAAQKLLGTPKRASIFLTPCREAVYADTFAAANKINKDLIGKGVSILAWNIFPKIKEAVAFSTVYTKLMLREAHPELCFRHLNGGASLRSKKNSPDGIADRMRLIEKHFPAYPSQMEAFLRSTKRTVVKPDDVVDAVVLAIRATAADVQAVLPQEQTYSDGNIFF